MNRNEQVDVKIKLLIILSYFICLYSYIFIYYLYFMIPYLFLFILLSILLYISDFYLLIYSSLYLHIYFLLLLQIFVFLMALLWLHIPYFIPLYISTFIFSLFGKRFSLQQWGPVFSPLFVLFWSCKFVRSTQSCCLSWTPVELIQANLLAKLSNATNLLPAIISGEICIKSQVIFLLCITMCNFNSQDSRSVVMCTITVKTNDVTHVCLQVYTYCVYMSWICPVTHKTVTAAVHSDDSWSVLV